MEKRMNRIFVNIDGDSVCFPYYNKLAEQKKVTPAMLYPFVDIYRNTQTTDLLFNIFCQMSLTESKYWDTVEQRCSCTAENGVNVDYTPIFKGLYTLHTRDGIDPIAVWIDRTRQNGMNPWISIRMNDAHCFDEQASRLRSMFYYKALENGWTIGPDYGYYRGCYNYEVEEVRERMLGYIREQLERYDVYGIELDYSREIQCFPYLTADMQKCTDIMTAFLREARTIVRECEEHRGHAIRLAVKCMRDIANNRFFGLDPVALAEEKLIDVIIPSPRWATSDSGIPVDEWMRVMNGIEVYPGIEPSLGVINGYYKESTREIEMGLAANYLSYRSGGLYFYNHFITPHMYSNVYTPLCDLQKEFGEIESAGWYAKYTNILQCAGDYDTIYKNPVRFVMIPQERGSFPKKPPQWLPLPAPLSAEEKVFALRTGPIPKDKVISAVIGIENARDGFEVSLNGVRLEKPEETDISCMEGIGYQPGDYFAGNTTCFRCVLDPALLCEDAQIFRIRSSAENEILTWVEINAY